MGETLNTEIVYNISKGKNTLYVGWNNDKRKTNTNSKKTILKNIEI